MSAEQLIDFSKMGNISKLHDHLAKLLATAPQYGPTYLFFDGGFDLPENHHYLHFVLYKQTMYLEQQRPNNRPYQVAMFNVTGSKLLRDKEASAQLFELGVELIRSRKTEKLEKIANILEI